MDRECFAREQARAVKILKAIYAHQLLQFLRIANKCYLVVDFARLRARFVSDDLEVPLRQVLELRHRKLPVAVTKDHIYHVLHEEHFQLSFSRCTVLSDMLLTSIITVEHNIDKAVLHFNDSSVGIFVLVYERDEALNSARCTG